jgi:phosphoribosylformimino-5-aminoimidazole carboxamide ribotide isomerase
MSRFRPCIDLHEGRVKQIVGGTLKDAGPNAVAESPVENFVADEPPAWFADRYRQDELKGGHVIKLGPGNDEAARQALAAYPGGLQIGGGITPENALHWIDAGASHVIVTSWLFNEAEQFDYGRLADLVAAVGKKRLVIDLSCRQTDACPSQPRWHVASNRWQTITPLEITEPNLDRLSKYCAEFLIHAADVEGKCRGIDHALVRLLGQWSGCPMVYAGGIATMSDIEEIEKESSGQLDYTVGSALDLFGGRTIRYADLIHRI